jgi:alkaline phosphatase D
MKRLRTRAFYYLFVGLGLWLAAPAPTFAGDFVAGFAEVHDRIWLGSQLWANPMEDWRVQGGRLECVGGGPNRNVHVLTRQLGTRDGTLAMRVRVGRIDDGAARGSAGFRLGIRDEIDDYRSRLLYGKGLNAGLSTDGALFVGNQSRQEKALSAALRARGVELRLSARPEGEGKKSYSITLTAHDPASGKEVASVNADGVAAEKLIGNLALVNNPAGPGNASFGKKGEKEPPGARFWFDDWRIDGSKVEANDSQAFGPILFAMHTLSRGVLKMTAQMPPIGANEAQHVRLQVEQGGGWKTVAEEKIHPLARTATFRVLNWNDRRDTNYRLAYTLVDRTGMRGEAHYTGTVRKDPKDKETLIVGASSCIADFIFPNREMVRNLTLQNPDMLFFAGDQVYEQAGGYGIIRAPVERAVLNYLRKWYLFGWAFRELTRERVTVTIPDDHDVYQGNYWGNGGNPISLAEHEAGGYVMPADFINVVHRTQTSHLPDPYDPTPLQQNITVYYAPLVYGRVGFAIVSDRMFKSGPRGTVATWPGRSDHLKDPKVDVRALDKPGLHLLGERQEKFLRAWGQDWRGVDLKCVLSQTNFCNVANYHGANREYLIADLDSGGWPQSARNRAIDLMRRAFALHLCGDQHLPSLVQYGIDEPGDANVVFCVPAGANVYPRSWQPDTEGVPIKNRPASGLPNTGDYRDGLGNPLRVLAVGNPQEKYRPGRLASMQDKSCGWGVVRFHHKNQSMTVEAWRILANVAEPKRGDQFPGWPVTIKLLNNYGRTPTGYLPTVVVTGLTNPVVQVIDEGTKEVVYTLRVKGDRFRPMVFGPGRYTVRIHEPETGREQILFGLMPAQRPNEELRVKFSPGS